MNSEERQNYNKTYYATNKTKILNIACAKVQCEFCKRIVIKNNIQKHKLSKLCKNTEKLFIDDLKRKNNLIIPVIEKVEKSDIVEPVEILELTESNVKKLINQIENKKNIEQLI